MNYEECVPLSQHEILEASECAEIREQVMALRTNWTPRGEGRFFTLGAASYLDAPEQRPAYFAAAQASNELLRGYFGWLHERVRTFFEDLLGESATFHDQYALPGFHIFFFNGEDRSTDRAANRAHFDLQWMQAISGEDPSGTVSFTLPIELPSGGSSMEIWHVRYQDAMQLGLSGGEYALKHPSQTIRYVPGRVVVHDGLILHAIGTSVLAKPQGFRITLQGHGARLSSGWLLYW